MSRKKSRSCVGFLLFTLLLLIGAAIIWTAIPILTEKDFGPAAPYLNAFQIRKYGASLLLSEQSLLNPDSKKQNENSFTIETGSSIYQISSDLENAGFISNGSRFRDYLIYKGYDSSIRAGTFLIPANLSAVEIADLLRAGNPSFTFFLYPGWRAEEVAEGLIASGAQITLDDFMRVVNNPSEINLPEWLKGITSLEGFLYPGEYELSRDYSSTKFVQIFVDRFSQNALLEISQKAEKSGYSIVELVTLASIIQRESLVPSELPMIASVFYNRMETGMKLETDPTVQYSIGRDLATGSWWKTPLSFSDLEFSSDFNTYQNYGLPPHAISNPGQDAINAVINPAFSPYYYFQANCDQSGTHVFSETYEEHLSHNCK